MRRPETGSSTASATETVAGGAATLGEAARAIVRESAVEAKCRLARETANAWYGHRLGLARLSRPLAMPARPGRPQRPALLAPRDMPRRRASGVKGRFALLHALAHIELNAVDMTWDLIARFAHRSMPRAFYDDWVRVGLEEAKHFGLLSARLEELGGHYGDLPAHDGLWQAAEATGHDLTARLAVVPLILEARGLDVTPGMVASLEAAGDAASAKILEIIYRDEKTHVAFGMKWFRYLCEQERRPLEPTFHQLVRASFRGGVKPPFNEAARSEAGLTPGFYKPLTAFGGAP
jgi:uncharacterized ferritin-like protein (DUF455 family)